LIRDQKIKREDILMKTKYVFILLVVITSQIFAQVPPCNIYGTNYSSSAGWTATQTGSNQKINILGGQCIFGSVPGNPDDIRIYRTLNSSVGNAWFAEFKLKVTNVGTNGGMILPFVLTAGILSPSTISPSPTNWSDQDAVGISCGTPGTNNTEPIYLRAYVKDGIHEISNECSIKIDLNVQYLVRIERYGTNSTKGRLIVKKMGPQGTYTFVGSCCFYIPQTVNGLYVIQSANYIPAYQYRNESAIMDDLCVGTDILSCCYSELTGMDVICNPNQSAVYSVDYEPNIEYEWTIVPSSISFSYTNPPNHNSITISNWGTFSGDVLIKLKQVCNCDTTYSIITVHVYQDLNAFASFDASTNTSGQFITPIICTPVTPPPTGAVVDWKIFKAANCTNANYQTVGNSLRPITSASVFSVVSPTAGYQDILKTDCYIIIYTLTYPNTPCPPVVKMKKIQNSGGKKLINPDDKPVIKNQGTEKDKQ
jgi:hypothetical protein